MQLVRWRFLPDTSRLDFRRCGFSHAGSMFPSEKQFLENAVSQSWDEHGPSAPVLGGLQDRWVCSPHFPGFFWPHHFLCESSQRRFDFGRLARVRRSTGCHVMSGTSATGHRTDGVRSSLPTGHCRSTRHITRGRIGQ